MLIRAYQESDWPRVWPIVEQVIRARDTYTYDPEMTSGQAHDLWVERPPGQTVVAEDGVVLLGTAKFGPNKPGPGSHVSTASFMVSSAARGRGVGRALGEYALEWARGQGYAAMQFNAVVEANRSAVALWKSLGFEIIGTAPEAFEHPTEGRVGLHIMYRRL